MNRTRLREQYRREATLGIENGDAAARWLRAHQQTVTPPPSGERHDARRRRRLQALAEEARRSSD